MEDLQRMDEIEWLPTVDEPKTGSGELRRHTATTCENCGAEFQYVTASRSNPADEWREWKFVPALCRDCEGVRDEKDKAERLERERIERFHAAMGSYRYYQDTGTRLLLASFELADIGPHNAAAFTQAKRWLGSPASNLVIIGGIGTGKSYLAACVYQGLTAELHPVLWLNAASYMATVKRGFNDREQAEIANQKARYAEEAPFLVLDDLGKVHPGKDVSYTEEQFYAIVDARYRNQLPTIVTTEWKSKALAERVGESVVSRLEDGAVVAGVKRAAEPYRKPKAA